MSLPINQLLQNFTHPELPEGLFKLMTNCRCVLKTEDGEDILKVTVTMPFACRGLKQALESYLNEQLEQKVSAEFICELSQTPRYKQVKNIVLVASGKGGVGKSTTAVNIALALAQEGAKVGLLDADIYGPSLPIMLGLKGHKPQSTDGKSMEPLAAFGAKVNSIGFLINPEDAAVWRGPMAGSALMQLIGETNWGELDYLVVDMPPGTGDIQLTLSQKFPCTGALIVTTPQNVALADAEKGVSMFNKVNIPVLGIVENMSYFQCSSCGAVEHIFGTDGAKAMAASHQTELLGQIPLEKQHRENADNGRPTVMGDNAMAAIYRQVARALSKRLYTIHSEVAPSGPVISFSDD